jgi:hypothetical protein
MLRFACPSCQAVLKAPEGREGAHVSCPRCGQRLQVPAAPANPDPLPAPPALVESTADRFRADPPPREAKVMEPEPQIEDPPAVKTKVAKKKKPSRRKVGLWVAAIGGVFLFGCFACTGLAGVGYWIYSAFQPDSIKPALKWIPDNSQLVCYVRIHEVGKSQFVKDLLARSTDNEKDRFSREMEKATGLTPKDISYVVIASRDITPQAQAQGPPEFTLVVRTKKNVTAADMLASMTNKCTDTKVGDYTMYTDNTSRMSFAVVDKRTIVFGERKPLRAVLERDGPAQLASSFKETLNDLEYNHHFGGVCNLKSLRLLQNGPGDFGGGFGADSTRLLERFEKAVVNEVETCLFTGDLNDPLSATVAVRYPNADAATKAKSVIDDLVNEAKRTGAFKEEELQKIKGQFEVKAKGRYVKVTFKCGRAEVMEQINKNTPGGNILAQAMGPMPNNPPPNFNNPPPNFNNPQGFENPQIQRGNMNWTVATKAQQRFTVRLQGNQQVNVITVCFDVNAQFAVKIYDAQNKLVIQGISNNSECDLQFMTAAAQDYAIVVENRDGVAHTGLIDYVSQPK